MAIYHLEAKVVSRGAGRSVVAASAYLSCARLYNDYDGIQHDYTRKQGLVWQEVLLPEYAPQEWQDRDIYSIPILSEIVSAGFSCGKVPERNGMGKGVYGTTRNFAI